MAGNAGQHAVDFSLQRVVAFGLVGLSGQHAGQAGGDLQQRFTQAGQALGVGSADGVGADQVALLFGQL